MERECTPERQEPGETSSPVPPPSDPVTTTGGQFVTFLSRLLWMDFAVDAVKMLVVDDDKDLPCACAVNHLIVFLTVTHEEGYCCGPITMRESCGLRS